MPALGLSDLGFAPGDRVAILHGDDLGMCHAANSAFADIVAAGVVSCGSVMVPCPWFAEMAAFAIAHPAADVGVHLTLTSEWRGYRWGPISTSDPASGLIDDAGFFWPDVDPLYAHMDPDAGAAELRAQVVRAIRAGIDVTHLDTHMGSILHPVLLRAYIALGLEFGVPVMLPRMSHAALAAWGVPAGVATEMIEELAKAEAAGGLFIFEGFCDLGDSIAMTNATRGYRDLLAGLPPGLTHVIYHASTDGDELRAIMGERLAARRVVDWRVFADDGFRQTLAQSGVHNVGYRALRDAMRR